MDSTYIALQGHYNTAQGINSGLLFSHNIGTELKSIAITMKKHSDYNLKA